MEDPKTFPPRAEYRESPKDAEIERLRTHLQEAEARVERLEALLSESLQHWEWFDRDGPYIPLSRQAMWQSWIHRARAAMETPKEE